MKHGDFLYRLAKDEINYSSLYGRRCGILVSISDYHHRGPGSIPIYRHYSILESRNVSMNNL